jgi:hypothetical protein
VAGRRFVTANAGLTLAARCGVLAWLFLARAVAAAARRCAAQAAAR